jgi:hypothetical protein
LSSFSNVASLTIIPKEIEHELVRHWIKLPYYKNIGEKLPQTLKQCKKSSESFPKKSKD